MKRLFTIYSVLIVLFFFTGCAGVWEFFGDIADKLSEEKPETTPEGKKELTSHYYLEKSSTYEKNDELQTALLYVKIAGTLDSDNTKIHEKIASLKSAIDHQAGQHFTTGVTCFKKGRFKDARKQFLTTLRYDPDHKEALGYLKNRLHPKEYVTYKVKDPETLKDISKKFYKDASKAFLIAYFNHLKTGSKLESGTTLELPMLGLEINRPPIHIPTALTKTKTLLRDKRYPESIKMSKKVTADDQGVEEALQQAINEQLIKAEDLLKQKQYEQALAVAQRVLDEDKSNMAAKNLINTAFCQQARNLLIRKNYTEALQVLTKADAEYDCVKKTISDVHTAKKKQAEVHYLKGVKYFLNEELQSAILEWEKALTLNPEHKKARKNIDNAQSLLEKLKKVK